MKNQKFITIALAVAVLFSFAACQQPTYKNIDTISIAQKGVILDGETVTPDMFEVTAHYTDGTSEAISAAVDLTKTGVASVSLKSYDKAFTADTDIKLTPIEGVEISGVSNVVVKNGTALTALVDLEAAYKKGDITWEGTPVATFTYDGGTKEYNLFDIDYVITPYDGDTAASSLESGKTYSVKLDKIRFNQTAGAKWVIEYATPLDLGITFTVADSATITSISLAAKTLYVGQTAKNEDWTVTATYSDNTTKVLEVTGYGLTFVEGVTSNKYGTVGTTVSAYATVDTGNGKIFSNLESATVEDYISTVVIVGKDNDTAVSSVEYSTKSTDPLTALTATGARLKVTTAGGTSTYNAVTGIEFSVPYLSNNTTTGESVAWTYPQAEGAPAMTTATGTISFKYVPQA